MGSASFLYITPDTYVVLGRIINSPVILLAKFETLLLMNKSLRSSFVGGTKGKGGVSRSKLLTAMQIQNGNKKVNQNLKKDLC